MRGGVIAAAVMVLVLGACSGDDEAEPAPVTTTTSQPTTAVSGTTVVVSFCDGAIALLDGSALPPGGGSIVSDLRGVQTTDLDAEERRLFVRAVDNLEAALDAFTPPVTSLGSWSTEEVVASVNAACGTALAAQFVAG